MSSNIEAQHVVVTGGSSGIGAAVVARLQEQGHTVTVFDLAEAPDGTPTEIVDATDEAAVIAAVESATARAGVITGLVTCHGIRGQFVPALEMSLDRLRLLYNVHLVGTLSVAREIVRRLNGVPASFVFISSTTAYRGWAQQADYGTAKAAVMQLTENLAVEWAPLGVRVNAVAPGHTLTPMVQDMIDKGYDTAPVAQRTPLGRLAAPSEQADAICYLLTQATYVTGQCLAVDGGWTAVGK
ncbi:SDR family NAD(P)-dependent oxidoreductase [Microbacterium sp. YY-03]|uniref:SDR family NAD(P)-dependent oxidoreductase n=1 Tax=Microbacterium sp. YY-03 TaxID=3421636 RepID=UPI003D166563